MAGDGQGGIHARLGELAIAGIKGEVAKVDVQVNQIVAGLNPSIAEADRFIKDLENSPG